MDVIDVCDETGGTAKCFDVGLETASTLLSRTVGAKVKLQTVDADPDPSTLDHHCPSNSCFGRCVGLFEYGGIRIAHEQKNAEP